MNLYCDNYATCNGVLIEGTEVRARAKGWHMFRGQTQGGLSHEATLCPRCAGGRPRLPQPPATLEGQDGLFSQQEGGSL